MNKVFLIFMILIFNCTYDNKKQSLTVEPKKEGSLNGIWIETQNKTDTLDFNRLAPNRLILARGTEIRSGIKKPKPGNGLYYYQIKDGRIAVRWGFSSSTDFHTFSFRQEGDTITVQNFYDPDSKGALEKFIKIK